MPPESDLTTYDWSSLLQQLLDKESLSREQASTLMQGWLSEAISPVMSGAILAAIQAKNVSPSELAGMAQVLQSQSQPKTLTDFPTPLIDTCGTGGDGASTFNISTAVAFVAAAAGIPVAKHGNRAASSKVGSADVLEGLGINLRAPLEKVEAAVKTAGITFLFAPGWHPAMKSVVPFRKALKVRTVFNLLGPLVNPLPITGQVMGVYHAGLVSTVAQALNELQRPCAIVLHAQEGLDEAGLADVTHTAVVWQGQVKPMTLDPQALGIAKAPTAALRGGELAENTAILKAVLQGKGTQPQQDVVALNAALALTTSGQVGEPGIETYTKQFNRARDIIASGAAWDKVGALIEALA
ncbi:MAG: anthranilate phosphoribosyltransferase [Cyanobacteria bacterium P01_A01_bin.135]